MDFDANNSYGNVMTMPLPCGDLEWDKNPNIIELPEPQEGKGYIAEVDLEYPHELHDVHNNYPLAPEHMRPEILAEYQESLWDGARYVPTPKLCLNLNNKKNYVVQGSQAY